MVKLNFVNNVARAKFNNKKKLSWEIIFGPFGDQKKKFSFTFLMAQKSPGLPRNKIQPLNSIKFSLLLYSK